MAQARPVLSLKHIHVLPKHSRMLINLQFAAPPSYEEWVGGRREIREDGDTEYTRGQLQWAPSYPIYKQLSIDSQTAAAHTPSDPAHADNNRV